MPNAPDTAAPHDAHPSLTEPVLTTHLRDAHGWPVVRIYQATYFQRLVVHQREHAKERLVGAS